MLFIRPVSRGPFFMVQFSEPRVIRDQPRHSMFRRVIGFVHTLHFYFNMVTMLNFLAICMDLNETLKITSPFSVLSKIFG